MKKMCKLILRMMWPYLTDVGSVTGSSPGAARAGGPACKNKTHFKYIIED
jgi:hypothetical protein